MALHRTFVRNLRDSKPEISISWNQMGSIPSQRFVKKYEPCFANKTDLQTIKLESISESEFLKYSVDPKVRDLFFKSFCESGKINLTTVV